MIGVLLAAFAPAHATRPDEGGGTWHYDASDVLEYVDGPEGRVRVHYSVEGPNQTILTDDDGDGYPDYPEEVAAIAEDVLDFYAGLGFNRPLTESEMGLDPLGGSDALDFYLLDFQLEADGMFQTEKCANGVCSGFMLMENDFSGYGYRTLNQAIEVLTSHELFHAVQAATADNLPSWMSEGMAVWGEYAYDYDVTGFDVLSFCDAYLDDTARPIYSPPAGMTTAWSYGTALFFIFLDLRDGSGVLADMLSDMYEQSSDQAIDAVAQALQDNGDSIEEAWPVFVRWNLATGRRAGATESYPFADELQFVETTAKGETIEDENRFYPLAATYYELDHPGGELYFSTADDPAGLLFSLHPVDDSGQVEDLATEWSPDGAGRIDLGDFDAGTYFVVGTNPHLAEQSTKISFCLGDDATAQDCLPASDTGDTGAGGAGGGAGGAKGCGGCASTGAGAAGAGLVGLLGLVGLGRRVRE